MKKLILLCLFSVLFAHLHAAPKVLWKYKTGGRITGSCSVADNKLLFGSEDGYMYALDKLTGNLIWKFDGGSPVRSTPAVSGDTLFFNNAGGDIYALHIDSGRMLWKLTIKGEKTVDFWDYYLSSPVVHGGLLIVGSGNGAVYALNTANGREKWVFKTGDVVHADPLIHNKLVYIGGFGGRLYALDIMSGLPVWDFKTVGDTYFTKGDIQAGASTAYGIIYFGSRDFNIYALNAEKGHGMWNMKERGSWIIATPVVADSLAFAGTSDTHAFYCFDAFNGEVKWRIGLNMRVYGKAAFHKGNVLFGCFNGKLYCADKKSGNIIWEFQSDDSRTNWNKIYDQNGDFRKDFALYGNEDETRKAEADIASLGSILASPLVDGDTVYFGSGTYCYALEIGKP